MADNSILSSGPVLPKVPFCIFAKPPRPGRAKTRLAAAIGHEGACELATAFLNDTLQMAMEVEWLQPVLATTEDGMGEASFPEAAFPQRSATNIPKWLQTGDDLGAKIESIVRKGLAASSAVVCAGADSPGRPLSRLEDLRRHLEGGAQAVIGPSEDGGYDLLALTSCREGLLADLPWSQPTTFEKTRQRLEAEGMVVAVLPMWWDVDDVEDLVRLRAMAATEDRARLPATLDVLRRIDETVPLTDGEEGHRKGLKSELRHTSILLQNTEIALLRPSDWKPSMIGLSQVTSGSCGAQHGAAAARPSFARGAHMARALLVKARDGVQHAA